MQQFGGARLGGIAADLGEAGVQRTDLSPSWAASAAASARSISRSSTSPSSTNSSAGSAAPAFPARRGDHPRGGHVEVALLGVQRAGEQREERGFAAAVAAGEADLPAGAELQEALSTRVSWRARR